MINEHELATLEKYLECVLQEYPIVGVPVVARCCFLHRTPDNF